MGVVSDVTRRQSHSQLSNILVFIIFLPPLLYLCEERKWFALSTGCVIHPNFPGRYMQGCVISFLMRFVWLPVMNKMLQMWNCITFKLCLKKLHSLCLVLLEDLFFEFFNSKCKSHSVRFSTELKAELRFHSQHREWSSPGESSTCSSVNSHLRI